MKKSVAIFVVLVFLCTTIVSAELTDCNILTVEQHVYKNVFLDFEANFENFADMNKSITSTQGTIALVELPTIGVPSGTHVLEIDIATLGPSSAGVTFDNFSSDTDWSKKHFLEFYAFPQKGSVIATIMDANDVLHKFPIEKYSISGYRLEEWNLIRIPVDLINAVSEIKSISFGVSPQRANVNGAHVYIDSLFVRDAEEQREYCIIGDVRDLEGTILKDYESVAAHCNDLVYGAFVGGQCCGNNPGESYVADGEICLGGKHFEENDPYAKGIFTINDNSFSYECLKDECTIPFPQTIGDIEAQTFTVSTSDADVSIAFTDGGFVSTTFQDIKIKVIKPNYVSAGEIASCGASDPIFNIASTEKTTLPSVGEICAPASEWSCSPNGYFTKTQNGVVKKDLLNDNLECCSQTSCLLNNVCKHDELKSGASIEAEFHCLNGDWRDDPPAKRFDNTALGFCSLDTDCFVRIENESSICVPQGGIQGNYVCGADRNWGSRTVTLAGYLEGQAKDENINEYSLYCDRGSQVANHLGTSQGERVRDLLQNFSFEEGRQGRDCFLGANAALDLCELRFCVLNPADSNTPSLIGISLYEDFQNENNTVKPILEINCLTQSSEFESCSNPEWKYNHEERLLVFVPEDAQVGFFGGIISFIAGLFTSTTTAQADALIQNSIAEKLYKNIKDGQTVGGYVEYQAIAGESVQTFRYTVVYEGFAEDVCSIVHVGPTCTQTESITIVTGEDDTLDSYTRLTAQLRLP
ncbi:MAG: hypothetical protein ACI8Y7_000303 [Candidatus Woesearchaeota archaeon]|jgi:hypothetical protein